MSIFGKEEHDQKMDLCSCPRNFWDKCPNKRRVKEWHDLCLFDKNINPRKMDEEFLLEEDLLDLHNNGSKKNLRR